MLDAIASLKVNGDRVAWQRMTLQVPDNLAAQAGCTTPELIFGLVVGLFFQGRLSLGQAGEALGLSKPGFMEQIHTLGLPMPYSAEDAHHDLDAINRVWPSIQPPAHL